MSLRWGPADAEAILKQHGDWLGLADDEGIEFAAKTRREQLIFTDRRVILADTQGRVRKTTEYRSVPYRSISRWSVESKAGLRDGAYLKLWLNAQDDPFLDVELQKGESGRDVLEMLSRCAI